MKYGMPFQGSKSAMAEEIIEALPSGKRLIDLFGGGGAITHCAVLSGKWKTVVYNELNSTVFRAFRGAICGELKHLIDQGKFSAPTHEEFKENIAQGSPNPYWTIAYSFGNGCATYLWGEENEQVKVPLENDILHKTSIAVEKFFGSGAASRFARAGYTRQALYAEWRHAKKTHQSKFQRPARIELQGLEGLKRLERLEKLGRFEELEGLERLERLERLSIGGGDPERLVFSHGDWRNVPLREGDIVYCDPPYWKSEYTRDGTSREYKYFGEFDHDAFYAWVEKQSLPIFISGEAIPLELPIVWAKKRSARFCSSNNIGKRLERLYATQPSFGRLF